MTTISERNGERRAELYRWAALFDLQLTQHGFGGSRYTLSEPQTGFEPVEIFSGNLRETWAYHWAYMSGYVRAQGIAIGHELERQSLIVGEVA